MNMIKVEALIREEKLEDVKEALSAIEVMGITVSQVMGCGTQKGYSELIRGRSVEIHMLPKIKLEILVSSEEWEEKVYRTIARAAFTGAYGDGKIFSYRLRNVMRVRTQETGYDAINETKIHKLGE